MANNGTLTGNLSATLEGTHGSRSVCEPFVISSSDFIKTGITKWSEISLEIPAGETYEVNLGPGVTSFKYLMFVTDYPVEVKINSISSDSTYVYPLYISLFEEDKVTSIFIKNSSNSLASITGHCGGE